MQYTTLFMGEISENVRQYYYAKRKFLFILDPESAERINL